MTNTSSKASTLCPAIFLAAPASGQGKTTITAAIARYFTLQGKIVRVFKTGPDYLDPQILEQASGQPVEQLDMWMAGEAYCQHMFYNAAKVADLILVEGAMGLFDGEPSSADLAARFNIPVALVMDVKGMAQTSAAIAMGLANYRDDFKVLGLIANNCGSERHAQLISDALPDDLPLLATFKRDPDVALPERHLGLVQASEIGEDLNKRFDAGAELIAETALALGLVNDLIEPVEFFEQAIEPIKPTLQGLKIGIARDKAFSFIYDVNLRTLREMGAEYHFFSPLYDKDLPDEMDALWFPGGYPELHAETLASNYAMRSAIMAFCDKEKPVLAECGGFLYCLESLTDLDENFHKMLGVLPGHGAMRGKRGCQGMQTAVLPEGEVRGHAHHRSRSSGTPEPIGYGRRQRHPAPGEAIYRHKGITATYLHLFFPSNPEVISRLFKGETLDVKPSVNDVVATALSEKEHAFGN